MVFFCQPRDQFFIFVRQVLRDGNDHAHIAVSALLWVAVFGHAHFLQPESFVAVGAGRDIDVERFVYRLHR